MNKKTLLTSFLFILSRSLMFFYLSPIKVFLIAKRIIWNVVVICSAQQVVTCFFLYFRTRKRITSIRFQKLIITQSNGVLGKCTAAILVYLELLCSEPHFVNLLHWIEIALRESILAECMKIYYAFLGELEYQIGFYFVISFKPHNSNLRSRFKEKLKILQNKSSAFLEQVLKFEKDDIRHYMCQNIFLVYPSITCALCVILNTRKNLSKFGSEIRERSYQRHSSSMNRLRKWRRNNGRKNTRAILLGEDMSDQFRKGTSRKIFLKIDDDNDIENLISEIFSKNSSAVAGNEEIIDQDSVYAISYRHCKSNPVKEVFAFLLAIKSAKHLAIQAEKSEYRIWCDKILNISRAKQKKNLWSCEGLLMYSYYFTIAVRNMEKDEKHRMWLLAEERLAYGSPGLLIIKFDDQSVLWKRFSQDSGPENSIRMYLRFLKTGEGLEEKTYHIADKDNFKKLSSQFGYVDDELEMLKGLKMHCTSHRKTMGEIEKSVWWPHVIDVETYASMRSIDYEKRLTMKHNSGTQYRFCGFQEWFNNNKECLAVNETIPAQFKSYVLKNMHTENILLIIRENSGKIQGIGILMIEVKRIDQMYMAEKTFRIYLQYDDNDVPEITHALRIIAEKEDVNIEEIRECSELFLLRSSCQCMMNKMDGTKFHEPEKKDHGYRIIDSGFMYSATCKECISKFTFYSI